MADYRVVNSTNQTIFWRDGAWNSPEVRAGQALDQESNHDADVTMYGKDGGGDHEWGRVWIHIGTTLEVYGDKNWRSRVTTFR